MAVNDMPTAFDISPDDGIEPIDSNDTPEPFELHPKWGRIRRDRPGQIVLSYDRRSDSLMVHFVRAGGAVRGGRERRVDLPAGRSGDGAMTGLRFDAFLDRVVPHYPEYVRLLEISELRGITTADVLALRRNFCRSGIA